MNLFAFQHTRTRRLLIAAWVVLIGIVVWGSLAPDDSPVIKTIDKLDLSDKACHFCAYVLLSVLAVITQKSKGRSVIAALLMGGLGIVLEILQGFTETRSADVADAAASWSGVACGLLLGLPIRKRTVPPSAR